MSAIDRRRRTIVGAVAMGSFVGVLGVDLATAKERVIPLVAKKFVFVPETIRVTRGETVVLHITAPEVPMGFNLADFGQRVDVMPGKVAILRFTPDKAGTFTFLCDVFCGSGHEDMSGTLVVT